MDFSEALKSLKLGNRVARAGWNGRNMWLLLVPGTRQVEPRPGTPYANAGIEVVDINPHIDMFTADGKMQPGWLASQTDMLADDWVTLSVASAPAKADPEDYPAGHPEHADNQPKVA